MLSSYAHTRFFSAGIHSDVRQYLLHPINERMNKRVDATERERRENELKVLFGDARKKTSTIQTAYCYGFSMKRCTCRISVNSMPDILWCDALEWRTQESHDANTFLWICVCVCVTPANDTIFNCIKIIDVSLLQLNIFPFLSAFLCKCAAGIRISFSQFQRRLILLKHVIALDRKCAPSKWI